MVVTLANFPWVSLGTDSISQSSDTGLSVAVPTMDRYMVCWSCTGISASASLIVITNLEVLSTDKYTNIVYRVPGYSTVSPFAQMPYDDDESSNATPQFQLTPLESLVTTSSVMSGTFYISTPSRAYVANSLDFTTANPKNSMVSRSMSTSSISPHGGTTITNPVAYFGVGSSGSTFVDKLFRITIGVTGSGNTLSIGSGMAVFGYNMS